MPIDYVIEHTEHRRWGQYWLDRDFGLKSEAMARRRIWATKKGVGLLTPTMIRYIETLQAFSLHIIVTEIRSYD